MADAIPLLPRKEVKRLLRTGGMSHRQIDALLRHGWRGLVSEAQAELAETHEALQALKESVGGVK